MYFSCYFFRLDSYQWISIGYTSRGCLRLDLQSLTSISATLFVVKKFLDIFPVLHIL